jgi:ATP-dependent Clp protease ATP-binding subunit ClpA
MTPHPDPEKVLWLTQFKAFLSERLFGQYEAIATIADAVKIAELGVPRRGKPKGAFLLLGPTGVGKTEITKLLTTYLYGNLDRMLRFNMAEYADEAVALGRLIGANSSQQGDLGDGLDYLNEVGGGVILVDEIEKAAAKVAKIWLAGIDEAEIGFANGTRKKLESSYIVMTSNLGAIEAMQMNDSGDTAIKNVLRNKAIDFFGPEMIGRFRRFDGVVVFNRLDGDIQNQICDTIIQREITYFEAERGIKIVDVTIDAVTEFKDKGYEDAMGARPMEGTVQRLMNNAYCDMLIECVTQGRPIPSAVVVDRDRRSDETKRMKSIITMRDASCNRIERANGSTKNVLGLRKSTTQP